MLAPRSRSLPRLSLWFLLAGGALLACASEAAPGATDLATADDAAPDDARETFDAPDVPDAPDTGPDVAPVAPDPFPQALGSQLALALDEGFPALGAPGAVLGVSLPGHEPWAAGAGLADVDAERAMVSSDCLRIGSITKTFNAALVLQLVDEGLLDLEAPVDDLVLGFELGPEVTVRRLLSHTAGIFNFTDDANFLGFGLEPRTPEEVIAWALEHDPPGAPGEGYSYSNTGFFLTGLVIEALRGQPFHEALRQRLLEPLGLDRTFLDGFEPGETTEGYVAGALATDSLDLSMAWAAGGMASTVGELCGWAHALFSGEVLPQSLTTQMIGPEVQIGSSGAYGLGVRHARRAGLDLIGHTGSTMGFVGELFYHPDSGACVALLTNDFLAKRHPVTGPAWQAVAAYVEGEGLP